MLESGTKGAISNVSKDRLLLAALSSIFAACSGGQSESMYIEVPPAKSAGLTAALADIVVGRGLEASLGQATDDHGHTMYVLEATGRGVRVWVQNMPISEDEALRCGQSRELHIHPNQYILTVTASLLATRRDVVSTVSREIRNDLLAGGLDVGMEPVTCGKFGP